MQNGSTPAFPTRRFSVLFRRAAAGCRPGKPLQRGKNMLSPKRTKFRKQHKGRVKGIAQSGASLNFGSFGLKAVTPGRLTARQIEAARRALTRHMKRAGRVWIRIFRDVPVSKKPAEARMGKETGSASGRERGGRYG